MAPEHTITGPHVHYRTKSGLAPDPLPIDPTEANIHEESVCIPVAGDLQGITRRTSNGSPGSKPDQACHQRRSRDLEPLLP